MKISFAIQNILLASVTIAIILLFSSCTQKMILRNAGIAPAAEAKVTIKHKDRNYHVDMEVLHLAPASQLNPSKRTFVVWMETERNGIKNIGEFNSTSSMFSKTLKGSVETITPFKPKGFFITAENEGAISVPAGPTILRTK